MPINVKSLIEELERIRDGKGLSKEKFAVQELKVSTPTYNRWTLGEGKPDADNIVKISQYIENEKEK